MEKIEFWDKRARLGFKAGTNDQILKKLEIRKIVEYVKDDINILDVGCGNGITALEIIKNYKVKLVGIDYSSSMIENAKKKLLKTKVKGSAKFLVSDINNILKIKNKFDLIYCERAIINLDNWEEQKRAIVNICNLLKPDGQFLMCENSQNSLEKLNVFRRQLNLEEITAPWHNRYIKDLEISELIIENCLLEKVDNFTSTYYFLSRVINAWQAKLNNKQPEYNAPINELALKLESFGDIGQTKLWVWKKIKC